MLLNSESGFGVGLSKPPTISGSCVLTGFISSMGSAEKGGVYVGYGSEGLGSAVMDRNSSMACSSGDVDCSMGGFSSDCGSGAVWASHLASTLEAKLNRRCWVGESSLAAINVLPSIFTPRSWGCRWRIRHANSDRFGSVELVFFELPGILLATR